MSKVLQHPLRVIGAALTLVVAATVFVVLFVPMAAGGSPGGKDEVRGYQNSKFLGATSGQSTRKVGAGQRFIITGKNFGVDGAHVDEVYCWDGVTDEGLGAGEGWIFVQTWTGGPDSKHLIDVIAGDACVSSQPEERILVQFNVPTADAPVFVAGPRLAITGQGL